MSLTCLSDVRLTGDLTMQGNGLIANNIIFKDNTNNSVNTTSSLRFESVIPETSYNSETYFDNYDTEFTLGVGFYDETGMFANSHLMQWVKPDYRGQGCEMYIPCLNEGVCATYLGFDVYGKLVYELPPLLNQNENLMLTKEIAKVDTSVLSKIKLYNVGGNLEIDPTELAAIDPKLVKWSRRKGNFKKEKGKKTTDKFEDQPYISGINKDAILYMLLQDYQDRHQN
jgi:hypothetical protein